MELVAAGLSFRSAPLQVRERAAVPDGEATRLLRYLVGHCGLLGAAVLSTCNRTDFYVSCPTSELADQVRPRLAMYLDPIGEDDIDQHLVSLRGAQAVRHMLRVSAGLESMVVGEPQVLGQVKAAHRLAREAGALDAHLDYVMRRAISTGKRVRSQTAVGRRPGSLGDAAVDVAQQVAGDLRGRGVLLLGAGQISAAAAHRLEECGARLHVASRGGLSAASLARSHDAAVVPADQLAEVADSIDVVIACTASPAPVLSAEKVAELQKNRRQRPLLVIDIAVPRDVEPDAGSVPGVTLLDIDDVGSRLAPDQEVQPSALAEAATIVENEVTRTVAVIHERDAATPTISALVQAAEQLRQRELARTLSRRPVLDPAAAQRVDRLTRSLVSKLLHGPISRLREYADDPAIALVLRDAFDLEMLGSDQPIQETETPAAAS